MMEALLPCCWSPSQDDADNLPSFPPYEDLWEGGRFVYLGSGVYYKKILFISVQVYAVALYVEAKQARAELQRLKAEGFFSEGYTDDRVMEALVQGRFRKALQIQMLRTASVSQFDNEISKDLRPRLERTGDQDLLQTFLGYFSGKSFQVGTSLLALWEEDGTLTGGLFPPGFTDFADATISISLRSENFCKALFDMYIGQDSIVPDGREQYVQGTLELLKL
ncbi:g8414 [Coccomyxa viridis]|uniref:G8414 protein n=1 Tax=Coccomyxa viridis TaxID=1274662 RepID=A0ABP1G709_9CHLO